MAFDTYDYSGTNLAEQYNTLILLDTEFEKHKNIVKPEFHILGGTALLFHGLGAVVTIDIDTANALSQEVKNIVEPFISDNASEVATLAKNYKKRLVQYNPQIFRNIDVYLLSIEDLIITKLGAGRHKDIEDLKHTDIVDKCDKELVMQIIKNEFNAETSKKLEQRWKTL